MTVNLQREEGNPSLPLADVKVVDLSWVMVGPISTRYLSDLGADVIKVESSTRIDPVRTLPPFGAGIPGPQRSVSYHFLNAGKRGIALDVRTERGREVVLRLAKWADVVVESFTPGVLDRLGLAYEDVRAVNPNVIMVSTSVAGEVAGTPGRSGVGTMGSAMSGATYLLGWPDRPPTGPFGPWTDAIAPRFIVPAILAALYRRSQTGEGSYIEVSQAEAGLQFLLPAFYEHALNGAVPSRTGSTPDPLRSPCGLYRCAGDDRYVSIDAAPGPQWDALRDELGTPLDLPAFASLIGRLRSRADLDAAIEQWTVTKDAEAVELRLQERGVPAHVVSNTIDLDSDAHLRASHLQTVTDPEIGEFTITGPQVRIGQKQQTTQRGPLIGEHTIEVLRDICNYDTEEISAMEASGILS